MPVGFKQIRLSISLDAEASASQREKLLELTKRYCVVCQTLLHGTETTMTL